VISITAIGDAPRDRIVYRSGAKDTDLICVSGDLGAAYMGLQLLEREKVASAGQKDFVPQFGGKEYLIERQLKPEARRDVIENLAKHGIIPTSMMDVSDGLSSELLHICKASDVGCRVYEDRIPIDYQTALMAEELNMNLVTAAMNGGETTNSSSPSPSTPTRKQENPRRESHRPHHKALPGSRPHHPRRRRNPHQGPRLESPRRIAPETSPLERRCVEILPPTEP